MFSCYWDGRIASTLHYCPPMSSVAEITLGMWIEMHALPHSHNRNLNPRHLRLLQLLWSPPCWDFRAAHTFSLYRKIKQNPQWFPLKWILISSRESFKILCYKWVHGTEDSEENLLPCMVCCFCFGTAYWLYLLCICWEHTFCRTFY